MPIRSAFSRRPEDQRKADLIEATLSLVAEGGFQSATVRPIAERAGVTPGLIRHYFGSKEALMREAYQHLMARMIHASLAASVAAGETAAEKVAAYVAEALRPPVVDARAVGQWAGFLHEVIRDAEVREIHRATYLGFRDLLEGLIGDLPRQVSAQRCRRDAIAVNAVLDGLWLEGSLLPDLFQPGEIESIGLAAIEAILGLPLPRPGGASAVPGSALDETAIQKV